MFEKFINRSVGDLLDAFGLAFESLVLLSEPPGQLSSFSFKFGEGEQYHWVRVGLRLMPELFSERCSWDYLVLRQASIFSIREGKDILCTRPWRTFKADRV